MTYEIFTLVSEYLGYTLIILGSLFVFLGSFGLYRFPDVYCRLQASTKSVTLGAMSLSVGVGLVEINWFVKGFLIASLLLLTVPISSSYLTRAAYKSGAPMWEGAVVDMYAKVHLEDLERERKE